MAEGRPVSMPEELITGPQEQHQLVVRTGLEIEVTKL